MQPRSVRLTFTPRDASEEDIRVQVEEESQIEGCVPTPKLFRKNQDTLTHPLTRRQIPVFLWRAEFTKLEAQAALDRGEKLPPPPCRLGQN